MIDNALDFEGLKYYDDKNKTYIKEQITIEKDRATAEESKKANIASPTFTGTPNAPTASAGTNTTQIATTAFVQTEIGNLINGAPETANTLKELSELIEEHQDVTDALNAAIGTKANQTDFSSHIDNKSNPHGVTKVQVGLGNVPNVATNNQTPSYTEATTLSKLSSGEKLSVAFGKISKAVTDLISHVADSVKHITSTERTNWNDANSKKHTHGNKTVLDNTTASYTSEEKTKLSGIATGAEVNQNAFSNVVVGSTTIAADSKTDTLTLTAGSNVTITPDATNDKITISSSHSTISKSTDTTSTASPSAGQSFTTVDSVTRDDNGHVTKINTKTVTLQTTPVTIDSALSSTSTNPLQNNIIYDEVVNKRVFNYSSPSVFGASSSSTLIEMINLMAIESSVSFWINNSNSYPTVYEEVMVGCNKHGYVDAYGYVTIEKINGVTAYVKWRSYESAYKAMKMSYSAINNVGWSEWEKIATSSDIYNIQSFMPIYATLNRHIADALQVNLNSQIGAENQVGYVYSDGSINMPSDCSYGIREVYYYNPSNIFVRITGWSTSGHPTQWLNLYNGTTWTGWTRPSIEGHNHTGQDIFPASVELIPAQGSTHGGFIDFHFNGSNADYTTRIIEDASGNLSITGNVGVKELSASRVNVSGDYPFVATNSGDETSIVFKKNDESVWTVGKGTGGIGNSFGWWSHAMTGNAAYLTPNGEFAAAGPIHAGSKVHLWTDNEGGNLRLISPNNQFWEMDSWQDNCIRIFHNNGSSYDYFHYFNDNFTSAGDVLTSSGVSLNELYTALVHKKIVYQYYYADNITIPANSMVTITFSNTQRTDGYCRAIMTVSLGNASSNGANSSFCTIYNIDTGATTDSNSYCIVRNWSSSAAVIQARCRMLYSYDKGNPYFSAF